MKHPALLSFLVVGTLAMPALMANASVRPTAAQGRGERRVYDRTHKDYHVWNDQEDRAYHRYLEERREKYRAYARLKANQQRMYWAWRHAHPDADLR